MKSRASQLFRRRNGGATTSRRWSLPCALALALLAGLARPDSAMAAGESATVTEEDEQAARRLFAQGDAAFKAGHYDEALKEFQAGYAASRRPGFLVNMAHTQRKLGHLREARALYKKYLLVDPTTKLRDEVRSIIEELDSALADEDRAERDGKDRDGTAAAAPPDTTPAPRSTQPPLAATVPPAPPPRPNQPVLLQQSAAATDTERAPGSPPFYRRGWFWVAVGAVVLTGAGAAIYASRRPTTDAFHDSGTLGSLGN